MTMVPDTRRRSYQKELIDESGIPESEMIRNIRELDLFNLLTGNISITLRLLDKIFSNRTNEYHIADLGCGGGELLVRADRWAARKNIKLRLYGVDNNATAISYLTKRLRGNERITPLLEDYKDFLHSSPQPVDVIHCSLFLHHLNDDEITELIMMARRLDAVLIINDLKRSLLAYYAAKALTSLFNGTYLAKNDGPVSVLRGFKKEELSRLVAKTGSRLTAIRSVPFFRYLLVIEPH